MKRFFLPLLSVMLMMMSCGHKMTPAEALQAYNSLQEENTTYMTELEAQVQTITTEEEYNALVALADSANTELVNRSYDIAKDFSGEEVCTKVLRDMYYYFSTDQKEVLFAKYTEEQLAADDALAKIHKAFLAELATKVGCDFTDFCAPQPDGTTLAVSDLIGKTEYLLVDFWASWCSPCRASMPALKALYTSLPAGRLEVLGCSLDNNADKWLAAIETLELPWRHISDLKGWSCEGSGLYGVSSIPATVLINRDGKIVGRNLSLDELAEMLKD